MVKEGERAPDFKLMGLDENGEEREYTLKGGEGGGGPLEKSSYSTSTPGT